MWVEALFLPVGSLSFIPSKTVEEKNYNGFNYMPFNFVCATQFLYLMCVLCMTW